MRAVNLIPADQRSGAGIRAGRSRGGAYAVLGLLGGLARARAALRPRRPSDLQPPRRSRRRSPPGRSRRRRAPVALAPYASFAAMREQRVQAVSTACGLALRLGPRLPRTRARAAGARSRSPPWTAPSAPAPPARAAPVPPSGSSVTSATPPGSVPTFTLTGCATSQAEVALTLDRLRLIDGVSEVTLQSSTKSGSAGGGGAVAAAVKPAMPRSTCRSPSTRCRASHRRARLGERRARTATGSASAPASTTAAAPRPQRPRQRERPDDRPRSHRRDRLSPARRARRRLAARRRARARAGRQARQPKSAPRRPSSRAPKVSSRAPAPRRPSTRPPTPRSSASAKPSRPSQEVPSLIYQLAQATNEKNVEFASITRRRRQRRGPERQSRKRAPRRASSAASASATAERGLHADAVHVRVQRQLQRPLQPLPAARRLRAAHDRRRRCGSAGACSRSRASSSRPRPVGLCEHRLGQGAARTALRHDHRDRLRAARRSDSHGRSDAGRPRRDGHADSFHRRSRAPPTPRPWSR